MEGYDSKTTGFSPTTARVSYREIPKPEGATIESTFALTAEEAEDLCAFVAKSEIFNLPERRSFGNEIDAYVVDGCFAQAELQYRGIEKKVTRLQSTYSLPFDSTWDYLTNLKKAKQPNKAPPRTPSSGTPAAGAPVAPPPGAAGL